MAISPLVLYCRVVTFDCHSRLIDDGPVYIGADERIDAVRRGADPAPAGFGGALELQTEATIYESNTCMRGRHARAGGTEPGP